jgi:hypothetical protein
MSRRVLVVFLILVMSLGLLSTFVISARADDGTSGDKRFQTVEIVFTEYTWELVDAKGYLVCRVQITHEGVPTYQEAVPFCQDAFIKPTQTPVHPHNTPTPPVTVQPTPTQIDYTSYFTDTTWRLQASRQIKQVNKVPLPAITINLMVSNKPVDLPYVTLSATEPLPNHKITSMSGFVDGRAFRCNGPICNLPVPRDAEVVYWATSSFGDESKHFSATVRVGQKNGKYLMTASVANNSAVYSDACQNIWGKKAIGAAPSWSYFPPSPDGLKTNKTLHFLAGKLIASGIVNARDCPGGGLLANGFPTGCGLERAQSKMIEYQNRYDPIIWSASREFGIPARLIKSLIEQESQFWPGNAQSKLFEYGLGQLDETGADAALRWDPALFAQVCPGLLFDCTNQYASQPAKYQSLIRGGLMQRMNATCLGCDNGIDSLKAEQSIRFVAQVLRSNCYQTNFIIADHNASTPIDDLWKFTLLSYHAGFSCLDDAVTRSVYYEENIDWYNVESHLDMCPNTDIYIDNLWDKLQSFPQFHPTDSPGKSVDPVFISSPSPTLAPIPTITPTPPGSILISGKIHIIVYIDYNENNNLDENERVDAIPVEAHFTDENTLYGQTQQGEISLSYAQKLVGSRVSLNVANIYHDFVFNIPKSGDVTLVFRLPRPDLPNTLP